MVKVVSWCQAYSVVMVCMHLMVTSCWSDLFPRLQPMHWFVPFIQLICYHVHGHLRCSWTGNTLMHSFRVDLQVCVGGHAHQHAEVHVHLQLELLLVFTLVSVMNGLDYMHAHNNMHAVESLACNQKHFSPCLLLVSCWDGSLNCTVVVSSMGACFTHCYSCAHSNWLLCLCRFMFSLRCCFNTCNSFLVPFPVFAQSSCSVVTS